MAIWKFKPYTEDDTRENPTQSQFFTTNEVESIANGLIREGIQNALDERLDKSKPVEIKISLSGESTSLSPAEYEPFLRGLESHLSAKESGIRKLPNFAIDKMNYLLFEDFNTKGLRGSPTESKDSEIEDGLKPHNFYYFWRNVGITGKPEDKLGRWGIGKTVFPASSRINSFWGYTIQHDTNAKFLLGQSILRKHNIESNPQDWGYKPYGYFGTFDTNSFFAKPLSEGELLLNFTKSFKLKRSDEPGLSIVVPFYKEEITKDLLIMDVIKQYFFPILNKCLEVTIHADEEEIIIDKESIFELVNKIKIENAGEDSKIEFEKANLISLFHFTEWTIGLADQGYVMLNSPKAENQPRWEERLWNGIDIDELIKKFELEKRIAFKIPVKFQNKDKSEPPKICWFKAYIEKDENLKKPEDHFIRENIVIIDVKSLEAANVRGMVIVDDKDLANLLGDSENPAHTQWQKDSQNFIDKYVHGDKCILFITRSLQRVYIKMQKPAAGLDKEILKDLFYIESDLLNEQPVLPDDDSRKDDETKDVKIDFIDRNSNPKIKIRKIEGGITLYAEGPKSELIENVSLKLAYLTTRGKPLRKYLPFDFEVNKKPIEITNSGCLINFCEKNEIEFSVQNPGFHFSIKGFDVKRDLFVKIDTQYKEND